MPPPAPPAVRRFTRIEDDGVRVACYESPVGSVAGGFLLAVWSVIPATFAWLVGRLGMVFLVGNVQPVALRLLAVPCFWFAGFCLLIAFHFVARGLSTVHLVLDREHRTATLIRIWPGFSWSTTLHGRQFRLLIRRWGSAYWLMLVTPRGLRRVTLDRDAYRPDLLPLARLVAEVLDLPLPEQPEPRPQAAVGDGPPGQGRN